MTVVTITTIVIASCYDYHYCAAEVTREDCCRDLCSVLRHCDQHWQLESLSFTMTVITDGSVTVINYRIINLSAVMTVIIVIATIVTSGPCSDHCHHYHCSYDQA